MRFNKIGDVVLHFDHRGPDASRPLLVFLNSLGTDFRIWDTAAADLGADFQVLLYDKRGHGLSDLGDRPWTIETHVDDVVGLIDHLGGGEIVLCGLSVGGLIAQGVAARRPAQVRALILCDTAHKIGTEASWNSRIDAVTQAGIAPLVDGILKLWFTPAFHANAAEKLAGCRNMLIRQSVAGYAGTCAAVRDADHTDLVGRIAVPTLCLVGDQDGSTPPPLVRSMADLIPGAEFEVIADAGHIPCVEQPDALVARIRAFLTTNGVL